MRVRSGPAAGARRSAGGRLAAALACVLVTAAVAAATAGCGGGDRKSATPRDGRAASPGGFSPSRHRPFSVPPGLSTTKVGFVYRVAADARHLVWLTGPVEEEPLPTTVQQRELGSSRPVTLVTGVDPNYGLASTARWVAYAVTSGRTRLMAMHHDGSGRVELSANLVAPLAARGELVAWAEDDRDRLSVVVRDMASGREWVAASMPRCVRSRCWRIDSVTLADDGVVFTRVASNPDASVVVRRAFANGAVSHVSIPGDPQPELVPSSAGALYYALGRGWYRWDFGWARPRRTAFRANPPAQLVGFEDGRWFVLTGGHCRTGLVALRRGRQAAVASPSRLLRLVPSPHGLCVQFGGFTWTGTQTLTGWGLLPEEEEEGHEVRDLIGIVSVGHRRP